MGVTQLDRDTPFLFFRETVGVDASQSPYQRCLAVVDMSGRAQDQGRKKTNWTAITVVEVIIGVAVRRALRIATSVTAKKKADPMAIAIAEVGVMTEVESPARSLPSRRS